MAGYRTEQINIGSIAAPDIGKDLINLGSTLRDNFQTGVSNTRNAIADQRDKELFDRQTNEYNRVLNERQVLREYASKPLDTATMIDSQRALMDEALNERAKQLNRPFTEEESAQIAKVYDSITPFREDVENKVYKDLVSKNIDPVKAKQYAQLESEKYQSIPEYQQMLNTRAEKLTANEKAQFEEKLKLADFERNMYKDEYTKWKDNQDRVLERLKLIKGAGGTVSGGSDVGGFNPDTSSMQEKINKLSGNEQETMNAYLSAVETYGVRAANNALASQLGRKVMWYDPTDAGKKDIDLDQFKKDLESQPRVNYGSILGNTTTSGEPKVPTYELLVGAKVYSPDSARAAAQTSARDRLLQVLDGFSPKVSQNINNVSSPSIDSTDSYANKVAKVESSGTKNPYEAVNSQSGAMGKYQFVNSTLNDYRKEFGNFTNEQFMKNPELQEKVFKAYTNDIDKFIENKGYEANDRNRWIAHNLGMGNLDKVLGGDFNDPGLKKAISVNLPKGVEPTVQNYLDYWKGFSASVPKEFEERTAKANREALFTVDNNGKKVLDEKAMALRKLMFDVNDKLQTIEDVRKLAPEASSLSMEELLSRELIQLAKEQSTSEDAAMAFLNRTRTNTLPEIIKTEFNRGREESLKEQQERQAAIAIKVKAGLPLTPNERAWIERMKDTKQNRERLFELGIE